MSARYDQEAIEYCRGLYHHYGGKNVDGIERDMQKIYPGWRRSNLVDRNKVKGRLPQLGWINRYGFDRSLEIYVESLATAVGNDDQRDYLKLKQICTRLEAKATNPDATRDDLYIFRDFFRLKLEVKSKLDVSHDNLETFVDCWEKVLTWIAEIDPKDAKVLVKHGPRLVELAEAHYGKQQEEVGDGAVPGADAGGDEPARRLSLVR